jgi:ribonuclease R
MAKPKHPTHRPPRPPLGLPDKDSLAAYIAEAGETDIDHLSKAFGVKGAERRALRHLVKSLTEEGGLARRGRKGFAKPGALPPVGVVEVVSRDIDGDLFVRLVKAAEDEPAVRLAPAGRNDTGPAPGIGDRLLAKFEQRENGEVEAITIKRLGGAGPEKMLGVVRRTARDVRLEPVDRKIKDSLILIGEDARDLKDGDLAMASITRGGERFGPKRGKLLEVIGREDDPRAASLIAIHSNSIPTGFSAAAEAEAEAAKPPQLKGREDLRDLPLITIDPADARDHDDAVYAHPDPDHEGGWVVWAAIADVAAYVRPGSALDREARDKGNSVYFPDRVEPMLPETLSNGLCSLKEGENRACLAVRMVFNAQGRKTSHRFVRGLMRSAAKLSYEEAQAAHDGEPGDKAGPIMDAVMTPLWSAYAVMQKGREQRSPLAIESAERRIVFNDEGKIASIAPREALEAHKLIEEIMVQANVCAAETLEQKSSPLIYRVHDTPSTIKVQNLADFLGTLGIAWSKGEAPRTDRFNKLLGETREGPHADIVNEVVLRTQMQAHYSTDNIGHFGLNLAKYAHFTSPIRRYADLTVHRGLIRALGLGDDGLSNEDVAKLAATAELVTGAERRAMVAERSATDRYIAAFLSDRVGAEFEGRITGVTKFGLFIRLAETGADGLVPVSTLGGEYFVHDERSHALIGERTGKRWPLGLAVIVRLAEATPVTGGLLFHMVSEPEPALEGAERPRGGGGDYLRRPGGGPGGKGRPGFRSPPRDKGARGKNTPKKGKGARKR